MRYPPLRIRIFYFPFFCTWDSQGLDAVRNFPRSEKKFPDKIAKKYRILRRAKTFLNIKGFLLQVFGASQAAPTVCLVSCCIFPEKCISQHKSLSFFFLKILRIEDLISQEHMVFSAETFSIILFPWVAWKPRKPETIFCIWTVYRSAYKWAFWSVQYWTSKLTRLSLVFRCFFAKMF